MNRQLRRAAPLRLKRAAPLPWAPLLRQLPPGASALELARAIAPRPPLIFADEPTGNLDEHTADIVFAEFIRLVLQHVLPKGLRRSRNFGFLHPNARRLRAQLKLLVFRPAPTPPIEAVSPCMRCICCGAAMRIVSRRGSTKLCSMVKSAMACRERSIVLRMSSSEPSVSRET